MNTKIDIPTLLSLTGTLLFCTGVLSQTVYYLFFNIHITEFLSISEVLLLFSNDILRYIIVFSFVLIFSYISSIETGRLYYKRFFIKFCQTNAFTDRVTKYVGLRTGSIIALVAVGSFLIFLVWRESRAVLLMSFWYSIQIVYFIAYFFVYEDLRRQRLRNQLKKESHTIDTFLSYSTYFIFFVLSWTLIDVQRVKYEGKFINVNFDLKGQIINSDSIKYYVGHSEKYLFYYDSKIDRTSVFKMDDIRSISFGKINYLGDSLLSHRNLLRSQEKANKIAQEKNLGANPLAPSTNVKEGLTTDCCKKEE